MRTDIVPEALEKAEAEFETNFMTGSTALAQAWMVLYDIWRQQLWKVRSQTFGGYLSYLSSTMKEHYPAPIPAYRISNKSSGTLGGRWLSKWTP